jgi:hypothetical protein
MKKILFCLAIVFTTSTAIAGSKPIQLSLTPNIALHSRHEIIEGLTLSIWGENRQEALSLGIVNGSKGQSVGASLGLFNYADYYRGIHFGLFGVNYTKNNFFGAQIGWFGGNYAGQMKGLQLGLGNWAEQIKGLQFGLVNYAGQLKGLQLGLGNWADTAQDGVQIGLVNIIAQNKWFDNFPDEVAPGMLFVNWRF